MSTSVAFLTSNQFFERSGSRPFNALQVASLKAWLRRIGFPDVALVIVRAGARNSIYIRITVENCARQIEAKWLDDLRRKKPSIARAQRRIQERFLEEVA